MLREFNEARKALRAAGHGYDVLGLMLRPHSRGHWMTAKEVLSWLGRS